MYSDWVNDVMAHLKLEKLTYLGILYKDRSANSIKYGNHSWTITKMSILQGRHVLLCCSSRKTIVPPLYLQHNTAATHKHEYAVCWDPQMKTFIFSRNVFE